MTEKKRLLSRDGGFGVSDRSCAKLIVWGLRDEGDAEWGGREEKKCGA